MTYRMTLQELKSLLEELIGEPVTRKFIAGNTIILWFKTDRTKGFYIAPPWRIKSQETIEATSADMPWEPEESESKENFDKRFNTACSRSDQLKHTKLTSVTIDPKTSDLLLGFANGRILKTFAVWREEESWHFSDHERKRQYSVLTRGVEIKPLEPLPKGD